MITITKGMNQKERAKVFAQLLERNPDGTHKHVICEGARFHVLSWGTEGTHCSEPDCEINKEHSLTN